MYSLRMNVCTVVGLIVISTAAAAAEPTAGQKPRTRADAHTPGAVAVSRCAQVPAVPERKDQTKAQTKDQARIARAASPYGDQYQLASRLQSDIDRYYRMIGCQPPLSEAYGAQDAWKEIDAATDDGD